MLEWSDTAHVYFCGSRALREAEARLKAARTYGGAQQPPEPVTPAPLHQHFGPVIVSCEHADVRPLTDAVWVYGDAARERHALERPAVPRFEVVDELVGAVRHHHTPLHDGAWGRATLQICLAMLESAREQRDVELA